MRLYGKTEIPNSAFECIGGPLCGSLIHPTGSGKGKYRWKDKTCGTMHYYRLVMLCDVVRPKSAIFFHYFGTKKKIANRSEPFLIPGKRLWHTVLE
jgi:hypothetical protein